MQEKETLNVTLAVMIADRFNQVVKVVNVKLKLISFAIGSDIELFVEL